MKNIGRFEVTGFKKKMEKKNCFGEHARLIDRISRRYYSSRVRRRRRDCRM